MVTSSSRSLFGKVHSATVYTLALGAGLFAALDPLKSALGSFAGTAVWVGMFLGVSMLVSMVSFGGLLRHNKAAGRGAPVDQPS